MRLIRLFALTVTTSVALSCGQDPVPDPPPDAGAGRVDAGADGGPSGPSGTRIGPEGGRLRSPDGRAQLDVPPGALEAAAELSIEPLPDVAGAVPGTSWELSPSGLVFATPVFFSMRTDPAAGGSTTAAERLTVVKVRDDGLRIAQPTEHDPRTGTATAALSGFSTYAADTTRVVPSSITRLTATHTNGNTNLTWTLSSPLIGDEIVLERAGPMLTPPRPGDWQHLATFPVGRAGQGDAGPFTPEAIYWYRLRVTSAWGEGPPTATFVGTFVDRPARPLAFTAQLTGRDVALAWDAFAVPNVDAFQLDIGVDGRPDSSPRRIPNTIAALTLWDVAPGHTYRYTLSAIRDGQEVASEVEWVVFDGFVLEVAPRVVRVEAGQTATTELRVHRAGAFTEPVHHTLSAAVGTLRGFVATFGENPSTGSTVPVQIAVASDVPPGRHNLILEGDAGGLHQAIAFYLDVDPAGGFDFTIDPSTFVVHAGAGPSYRIAVTRFGNFVDPVRFEFVGLPDFMLLSSPPSEGGGYFIVGEGVPGTRHEVVLRGTSGNLVVEKPVVVEVVGAPAPDWFVLRNHYDYYVEASWAEVPSATGYVLTRDGVEIARMPMGVTSRTDHLPDSALHVYELFVEVGAEVSIGRRSYYSWSSPSDRTHLEIFARCRPAAVTCDPPVELEFAGDDDMTFEVTAGAAQCSRHQLEVLVDGQLLTTSTVLGPGETTGELPLHPTNGSHRYGLRAVGVPGFGCTDAAGTLQGWTGAVLIRM